ncbi:MAG: hypothetical protein PHO35_07920 [Candidatus Cloacimonetes bacterium]|jgi:hypothetical protein|nr:hypothetical protein [Candidatus Cloacimonadota bacterium]
MNSGLIKTQHLAMKLAIFIIGLATGVEASFRQIALQGSLFLVFMLLEPALYLKLFFGLRKLVFFLCTYWIFATLFSVDFISSLLFSARLIYLLLVMVLAFASADKDMMIGQCSYFLRFRLFRALLSYILSTAYFLREYIHAYQSIPKGDSFGNLIERVIAAGAKVHGEASNIQSRVDEDLRSGALKLRSEPRANLLAAVFLFALVMVNSL